MNNNIKKALVIIPLSVLVSLLILFLIYKYDNKYTKDTIHPINGVLIMSENDLNNYPISYLIRDWIFFPNQLLKPEDIKNNSNTYIKQIFIGQYGHMSLNGLACNLGTYKLTIHLPEKNTLYALDIPEIFSAYNLYINGTLFVSMGNIDKSNYSEAIQTKNIIFQGNGKTEIVINVASNTGLYSGIVYPLSFGKIQAIENVRNIKLIIHSSVIILTFAISIISLYFGIKAKQKIGIIFSIFCFFYIGITAYPITHSFYVTSYNPLYTLEALYHYILLFLAVLIHNILYKLSKKITIITSIPYIFIAISLLIYGYLPITIKNNFQLYISLLSAIIKLFTSLYLITVNLYFIKNMNKRNSCILLSSAIFLSISMIFDRIYPNYEPIYGGWFNELGSFALLLAYSITIWQELVNGYLDKISLETTNNQINHQLNLQKQHFEQLSKQIDIAKKSNHDLRHHMRTLHNLASTKNYKELIQYLNEFNNNLSNSTSTYNNFSNNLIIDSILNYYYNQAKKEGINCDFTLKWNIDIKITDIDICTILSNLLENALEACCRSKNLCNDMLCISVNNTILDDKIGLVIRNNYYCPIKIKNNRFLSSKRNEYGIGISSVKKIVENYNGIISISTENNIFEVKILI